MNAFIYHHYRLTSHTTTCSCSATIRGRHCRWVRPLSLKWLMNIAGAHTDRYAGPDIADTNGGEKRIYFLLAAILFLFLKKTGGYIFSLVPHCTLINLPSSGFFRALSGFMLPPVILWSPDHFRPKSLANFAGWKVYGKISSPFWCLAIPMLLLQHHDILIAFRHFVCGSIWRGSLEFSFRNTSYALIQNFTITFILVATVFLQDRHVWMINLGILYFQL